MSDEVVPGEVVPGDAPVVDRPQGPSSLVATIGENDPEAYRRAARLANTECDIMVVQHEFGIYGGEDGSYVLEFLAELEIPVVLTLHTVLPAFSEGQTRVLRSACEMADEVTVFTPMARKLLAQQQIVFAKKVRIVPHGAPDALFGVASSSDRTGPGDRDRDRDRYVIATFGLVSPGKGLELAIEALPLVVAAVPQALLVIAGQTHPGVRRREGEHYRESLVARIEALGLSDHVRFVNEFLPVEAIADLLACTDVFVTPYVNPDQIVSGALTFALAAGCPVVSTDYQYARDQLGSGAGVIVSSRRPEEFARALLSFALDPEATAKARLVSLEVGAATRWTAVGRQAAEMFHNLVRIQELSDSRGSARRRHHHGRPTPRPIGVATRAHPVVVHLAGRQHRLSQTPRFADYASNATLKTGHLEVLVDDSGIIQHATGAVPLLSSGYCVDDVSRLIPVALALSASRPEWGSVVARSVAFVGHAASNPSNPSNGSGARLHNFLSWSRTWLDVPHFGDHVGRAAWGLSSVAGDPRFADVSGAVIQGILRDWPNNAPLHAVAYGLLAQTTAPWLLDDRRFEAKIHRMVTAYEDHGHQNWKWFEPRVRYDAAQFPRALMAAGALVDDRKAVEVGVRSLLWFDSMCDRGDYFRFPGHRGLGPDETVEQSGDEQPLEALALAEAHALAYELTNDGWHLERAQRAHEWFLGRNRLRLPLVDPLDGGCFDGLSISGVNRNQGAESTLAYAASFQLISSLGAQRPSPLSFPSDGRFDGRVDGRVDGPNGPQQAKSPDARRSLV